MNENLEPETVEGCNRARYAIYFAPEPGTALHAAGSRWLGRDAVRGNRQPQPTIAALPAERMADLTRGARHYGFHATLKPPFQLRPDARPATLLKAVSRFAAQEHPFPVRLGLATLDGFFALMETEPDRRMSALAARTVKELDRFRAPPEQWELDRRRGANLSARQEELLLKWGYPYVMDMFRFHMTLTMRVGDKAEAERLRRSLLHEFDTVLGCEQTVDAISVFAQSTRAVPFREIARMRFGRDG